MSRSLIILDPLTFDLLSNIQLPKSFKLWNDTKITSIENVHDRFACSPIADNIKGYIFSLVKVLYASIGLAFTSNCTSHQLWTNNFESSDLFSMRRSKGVFPRLLVLEAASLYGVKNDLTSPAVRVYLEVLSYTSNKVGGEGAQQTKWSGRFPLWSACEK